MSIISKLTNSWAQDDNAEKRLVIKYAFLTAALFLPLRWAFVAVRNLYPITAWNVMMAGGDLERGRSYCILRGETVSGETIDQPGGLFGRAFETDVAIAESIDERRQQDGRRDHRRADQRRH